MCVVVYHDVTLTACLLNRAAAGESIDICWRCRASLCAVASPVVPEGGKGKGYNRACAANAILFYINAGSSQKLYKIEKLDDEWIKLECYMLGITVTVNCVQNTMSLKVSA